MGLNEKRLCSQLTTAPLAYKLITNASVFIKFDEHGDYKMLFIYLRTTMPMCDNDTDLYNSGAVHPLSDQSVTRGRFSIVKCLRILKE